MEHADIEYVTRFFSMLSGVPARVYDDGKLIHSFFPVQFPIDPADFCRKEIEETTGPIGYIMTPYHMVYGIINHETIRIVMGPTEQVPSSDQLLRKLAFDLNVAKDDVPVFVNAMKSLIRMPVETFLMMLCPIYYFLSGEKLELHDVSIKEVRQKDYTKTIEEKRTEEKYETERLQTPNNTLQVEEMLLRIVRKGHTAELKEWIKQVPAVHGGVIAPGYLRQIKNTFIVTATLVSRAAIHGGMSAEDAFLLSDAYIQKMELFDNPDAIINLQYHMISEYTEQVEKVRRGQSPSKLVLDVTNYVQHHLSEPISTDALARELFLSRTHLSARFKAESGMTLTDFILNQKVEEAKRLLRFSDKSVAAIGVYLGFSSHGHFTKVFKKYTDLTPKEYRDKYV